MTTLFPALAGTCLSAHRDDVLQILFEPCTQFLFCDPLGEVSERSLSIAAIFSEAASGFSITAIVPITSGQVILESQQWLDPW